MADHLNNGGEGQVEAKELLNTPCTIKEAVQIARAVAEDVVTEYISRISQVQTAISLQVETLKQELFAKEILNEDEFKNRWAIIAQEVEEMRKAAYEKIESVDSDMSMTSGDIEVSTESGGNV